MAASEAAGPARTAKTVTDRVAVVIPCFNEAARLPVEEFLRFQRVTSDIDFVFVNDGSRDGTLAVLQEMAARGPRRITVVDLPVNQGKAEAVRAGLLAALDQPCAYVGYWDADLATPLEDILRFRDILKSRPDRDIVFGARVQLLGLSIHRSPVRHYTGRIFATMASLVLGLPVYDTQCGAKLFRVSSYTPALFEVPFCTRWLVDIEIIARLFQTHAAGHVGRLQEIALEIPVTEWRDVAGSKVRALDFLKAAWELQRIRWRYLRPSAR
jgi:dolichyl-phosphate beta-glucosyltransferase